MKLLFVCSQNKWRSPTAEQVFRRYEGIEARSAGVSQGARHTVSLEDIRWADLVFVMEEKHKSRLRADFRQDIKHTPVHVLDIPDDYRFMDPELVDLLVEAVEPFLTP